MRKQEEVETVMALVATGLNDCEIARQTDIPRRTIVDWRNGKIPSRGAVRSRRRGACAVCAGDPSTLPASEYAFLLGLYLGDGCISDGPRTYRLRIALDSRYPKIIADCAAAIEAVTPGKEAWRGKRPRSNCVDVAAYWNHWPCVLPQHGPGRKHLRRIELTDWQQRLVSACHEYLIRGLIQSDGCRVVANDRGISSVRYHFSNRSEDIKRIYCKSLDALGIGWTRPCGKQIAVYSKAGTARLDEFVGPKQ
jgi:hypothetical protein